MLVTPRTRHWNEQLVITNKKVHITENGPVRPSRLHLRRRKLPKKCHVARGTASVSTLTDEIPSSSDGDIGNWVNVEAPEVTEEISLA
jgi:hypothetical protein